MDKVLLWITAMVIVCVSLIAVLITIPNDSRDSSTMNIASFQLSQNQEWKTIKMGENYNLEELSKEKIKEKELQRYNEMRRAEIQRERGNNVEIVSMGDYNHLQNINEVE